MKRPSILQALTSITYGILAAIHGSAETIPNDPYGILKKAIPEKTVVLTFDDSCLSHATFVAPLLKQYGLTGTFYVSDGFAFRERKDWYMSWAQVKSLEDYGAEVGNHTLGHGQLSATSLDGCRKAITGLEELLATAGVRKPTTFCWPFYNANTRAFTELTSRGYTFARGGGGRPYRPTIDCPFDTPSFDVNEGTVKQDKDGFFKAVQQAKPGQIVILTFHGVPDIEHPSVGIDPKVFEGYVRYLKENQYTCLAMRDLGQYVDTEKAVLLLSRAPELPWGGHSPSWGGVTQKGNQLFLSIDQPPTDGKLTLPGMTTRIGKAYRLADPDKHPLNIEANDRGIQTVLIAGEPLHLPPGAPLVVVADLEGSPRATVLDFVFPGLPAANLAGNEVTVEVPLATDRTKLSPIYNTGSALVTGQPPSGSTGDFTRPRAYRIKAPDGAVRKYFVSVTPKKGAVGVSNPSFERFDRLNEFGVTEGTNPSGVVWEFSQPHGDGELGIKFLGGSTPPSPDGSLHAAFLRGAGNGFSQEVVFDAGEYVLSFDVVKRRGYEPSAAALRVSVGNSEVIALTPAQISEEWTHQTSPPFHVSDGVHRIAFTLGEGGGMDFMDNVRLQLRN
jgi:peptidoglycan/xylan/chitin deacetylase (PgdA/CDA1 family)